MLKERNALLPKTNIMLKIKSLNKYIIFIHNAFITSSWKVLFTKSGSISKVCVKK